MKNLKEKVLSVFRDNGKIEEVTDDLKNYQKKLAEMV